MADDSNESLKEGRAHSAPIRIPEVRIPVNEKLLRFSFRHLDLNTPTFHLSKCESAYFSALLQRIRDYSAWTVEDFRNQHNNEHRHVIVFRETTVSNGFTNVDPEQLGFEEPWQFQLVQNRDWRVHGFLLDDTFYIVWLDPEHLLYPRHHP